MFAIGTVFAFFSAWLPGSTPSASFGLSFACATNQINNLQQER
jgi:hypothetical protein